MWTVGDLARSCLLLFNTTSALHPLDLKCTGLQRHMSSDLTVTREFINLNKVC